MRLFLIILIVLGGILLPLARGQQAGPGASPAQQPAGGRPMRVFMDSNPTPIFIPNPKWHPAPDGSAKEPDAIGQHRFVRNFAPHDYMLHLGFIPSFILYDGTLNRASCYIGADGKLEELRPALNRWAWDPKRETDQTERLDRHIIRGLAQLARNPSVYGADLKPYRPIFIDIEGSKIINGIEMVEGKPVPGLNNPVEFRKSLEHQLKLLEGLRSVTGEEHEIYWYANYSFWQLKDQWSDGRWEKDPQQAEAFAECKRLLSETSRRLSGVTAQLYNTDFSIETDGEGWFAQVKMVEASIVRDMPQFANSKIAFLQPLHQVYWPHNLINKENAALNGTPVDLELWKKMLRYLHANGWDVFIWTGEMRLEEIRPHLDAAAEFVR